MADGDNADIWFRGVRHGINPLGLDYIWLSEDEDFAKEYGDDVYVCEVDDNVNICSVWVIDDLLGEEFDEIDPDDAVINVLEENGFDGYWFTLGDSTECMFIASSAVKSIKLL